MPSRRVAEEGHGLLRERWPRAARADGAATESAAGRSTFFMGSPSLFLHQPFGALVLEVTAMA